MPIVNSTPRLTVGIVGEYYKKTNTADVYLSDVNGVMSTQILADVPVAVVNGLNHCGPYPGQRVLIDFVDGQYGSPVIIGVIERAYNTYTREHNQTHQKRGAFLPDLLSKRKYNWEIVIGDISGSDAKENRDIDSGVITENILPPYQEIILRPGWGNV